MKRPDDVPALETIYRPIAGEMDEFERRFADCLRSPNKFVAELAAYATHGAGKRFRPALLFLSARAAGDITDVHIRFALAVESIHTATLVHDDVLDEASLRRRKPTMNVLWGNEPSVLFGDYLFANAFRFASSVEDKRALRIISEAAATVCEGELMQISERGNVELTEEKYLEIVTKKTATLCECACGLGALLAGAGPELKKTLSDYGQEAGIAFQIVDDCLDLVGDEEEAGKSLGTDLKKGKYTLPMIHLFRTSKEAKGLIRGGVSEPAAWKNLQRELLHAGSVDYALSVARARIARAKTNLTSIASAEIRASLENLADYIIRRKT